MVLGKLEKIKDLRKVWPHEVTDLTPEVMQWLKDKKLLLKLKVRFI